MVSHGLVSRGTVVRDDDDKKGEEKPVLQTVYETHGMRNGPTG